MTVRFFALVLAVLFAATPVISVVCEMNCDRPAAASSTCHEAGGPHDGTNLRGASHACDHDHTGASAALLTGARSRDSVGASFAAPAPALAHAFVPGARIALAAHGPPGLTGRSTSFHITILRI